MKKYYYLSYTKFELDLKHGAIKRVTDTKIRASVYEEYPNIIQFVDNSKLATDNDLHDFTDLLGYPVYDFNNWNNIYSHTIENDILTITHKQCDYKKDYYDLDAENKNFYIYIFNLLKTYSVSINALYTLFKDLYSYDIPSDITNHFEVTYEE